MDIKISFDQIEHIKNISHYNNNYYKITAFNEGCQKSCFILYEQCDEAYDTYDYYIFAIDDVNHKKPIYYWSTYQSIINEEVLNGK